ncbi:MAG: DUF4124 domain-containing protein [Candidatus Competibacteraceae bacterium]
MRPTFSLTLILTLALGSMAQAQVYKWTDANGQVHYDSKPPSEGQAVQTLDIQGRGMPLASRSASIANLRQPARIGVSEN